MQPTCKFIMITGLTLAVLGLCPVLLPRVSSLVGTGSFAPHRWLRQSNFLAGTIFNPATTVDAAADVASQPGMPCHTLQGFCFNVFCQQAQACGP